MTLKAPHIWLMLSDAEIEEVLQMLPKDSPLRNRLLKNIEAANVIYRKPPPEEMYEEGN